MKQMTSRGKILLGCAAMVLAMIGDYLMGFGTYSLDGDPSIAFGLRVNVVPDWRYALSSLLSFEKFEVYRPSTSSNRHIR
ncbi:MAG: hypothetical protein IJ083_14905 [Clostridia bacterium]|nr:hypothetical protein [Clostridia bacterium]